MGFAMQKVIKLGSNHPLLSILQFFPKVVSGYKCKGIQQEELAWIWPTSWTWRALYIKTNHVSSLEMSQKCTTGHRVLFIVHKTPARLPSSAADKFDQKIQHCVRCIPAVL